MSYDDYARHIIQKYRLAVCISVIRSKPENIILEDYIKQLRHKICVTHIDSDDLSIGICADDFHIDDTDNFAANIDDIDKNNDVIVEANNFNDKNTVEDETNDVEIIDLTDFNDLNLNIDQSSGKNENKQLFNDKNGERYHQTEENDVEMIDMQDLNDSITILQNYDEAEADVNDTNAVIGETNSLADMKKLNKGINDNITTKRMGISMKNPSKSISHSPQTSDPIDITEYLTDNDATLCESLDISPNKRKQKIQESNYNFNNNNRNTSINRVKETGRLQKTDILTKQIEDSGQIDNNPNLKTILNTEVDNSTNKEETKSKIVTKQNTIVHENIAPLASKPRTIRDYRHTKEFKNVYQNVADIFDTKKNEIESTKVPNDYNFAANDESKEIPKDSQETVIFTISDRFLSNTHYSESQDNDIIIMDKKFIHGTNNNKQSSVKDKDEPTKYNEAEILNENDIFSQETQITNSSHNDNGNRNNESNIRTNNDMPHSKDDETFTKRQQRHIDNDIFSLDSQLTNFLTSSTDSSQIFYNNNAKNYREAKMTKDVEKKSAKSEVEHDILSQESRTTNFLTSSTNSSQIFYNNNAKNNREAFITCIDVKDFPIDKINAKSKVRHVNNELFSQETQLTNFSTVSADSQNLTIADSSLIFSQNSQYIDFNENENNNLQAHEAKNEKFKEIHLNNSTAFDKDFKNTLVTDRITSSTNFYDNLENVRSKDKPRTDEKKSENMQVIDSSCVNFDRNDSMRVTELTELDTKCNEKLHTPVTDETCTNFDKNLEDMEEEWTDSQIELIPFKVIEELNKVKGYINRNKKMSSDLGYRSDSQSINSQKLSQSSAGWLNQAAHCLFNYITECPLVVTTQDVTNEISVVLAQLIDKLYQAEMYPSFLEELMNTVQSLITLAYEGTSGQNGQNVLQNKDVTVQRIILLNKSIHIQKYTIEKITVILDNLHTELTTSDSLHEIKNIDEIENTCYIFHILEIILQKYNKTSQSLSQSTQNSQEDEKILKMSNITEIWRKKWNPNCKSSSNEGSTEKVCVLSVCGGVLNKLIVGCMDGYSLISYSALKCFNVMQN